MDWFTSPIFAADDAELVRRLRSRDSAAAGELYERYGRLLFPLILNIAGDRRAAEDLLAEVLLKAFNEIQRLETDDIALGPWLLLLARNHALNFRYRTLPPEEKLHNWSALEAPAIYTLPALRREDSQAGEAARREFVSLPESDRLILELAWFEAMNFDEIALRLDRPASGVAASAEAALGRLRET